MTSSYPPLRWFVNYENRPFPEAKHAHGRNTASRPFGSPSMVVDLRRKENSLVAGTAPSLIVVNPVCTPPRSVVSGASQRSYQRTLSTLQSTRMECGDYTLRAVRVLLISTIWFFLPLESRFNGTTSASTYTPPGYAVEGIENGYGLHTDIEYPPGFAVNDNRHPPTKNYAPLMEHGAVLLEGRGFECVGRSLYIGSG